MQKRAHLHNKNDIKDVDEEVKDVVKTFIDPALIEKGKEEGLKKGLDEGLKKGLDEGLKKGLEEGRLSEKRKTVLKMIKKRYGTLSKELEGKVNSTDIDTLDAVIDGILDNKTLGEIEDILR